MPKTIADLITSESAKPAVIGKSMIAEVKQEISRLQQRVQQLEEQRRKENEILEAGGYDYNGNEAWIRVMERLGRR